VLLDEVCGNYGVDLLELIRGEEVARENELKAEDFEKELNKKITVPLSESDLQDLQNGETFDWTFDGVDVHIKPEGEEDFE
jgi:hypothetical protein